MVTAMTVRSMPVVAPAVRRPRTLGHRARRPLSAAAMPLLGFALLELIALYVTVTVLLPAFSVDTSLVLNYDPDATYRAVF